MLNILDLFEESELTEKGDGNFKVECPSCGADSTGYGGLILFVKSNTSFCHNANKWFTLKETFALKKGIMSETILDEEQNKEAMELFEEEFGADAAHDLESDEIVKHNRFFDVEENMDDEEIEIVDYKAPLNVNVFTEKLLGTTHLKNYDYFDKYLGLVTGSSSNAGLNAGFGIVVAIGA